ncbi:MAG: hypothetical protein F7B17_00335 [Desulfurococcales archaeon]|nr:hypothetical protein [Desulfurococcales archaeon]
MASAQEPKRMVGMALTVIGILLLLYAIASGLMNGQIGTKSTAIAPDVAAFIVGWFAILIGPALWLGEVPAAIRRRAGRS